MNNYMQNKHKKTKDGEDRFSNGLQDSRKNVNFLGFLISLSDNFGEVVYQETPEDVGKNEMNTKTQ